MIWTFLIVCTGLMSAYEAIDPQQLTELRDAGNYEEFARLLGVEDVDLVRPSKSGERSEVIDMRTRPVSPLGDILLSKEQREHVEQARTHLDFVRYPSYKWPKCTVCYWIVRGDFDDGQIRTIEESVDDFNKRSHFLKFFLWTSHLGCDGYVYFFSGNGCWSHLGKTGGGQPISLQANGCVWKPIVQHEMMHACGVHHEQTRCDRDKYIQMHYENIPENWHSQYEKQSCDVFKAPPCYDYYSVMHYGIWAPETGKKAFSAKQNDVDENRIGNAPHLSDDDVRKLNDAYRHCDKPY